MTSEISRPVRPAAMLIVAHGSRDPRHAATVAAVAERVRAHRPGARVAVGFLELSVPLAERALFRLREAGEREVVVLPLLLSRAYHATHDLPALLAQQRVRMPDLTIHQADVLGPVPEPLLTAALERRLAEAGLTGPRGSTGVVLASAGTSDPAARAVLGDLARQWQRAAGWHAVTPAYASASPPGTAEG